MTTFRMCRVCNTTYALTNKQAVCGWCDRAYRQALADAVEAVTSHRCSCCDYFTAGTLAAIEALGD